MSMGTTDDTGIRHSYFANIFGPPQSKEMHDEIVENCFRQMFKTNIYVGKIRTRLGIKGMELIGPKAPAQEMLNYIEKNVS